MNLYLFIINFVILHCRKAVEMPGGRGNIRPEDNPKPWKKGQSGNPQGYYRSGKLIKELKVILTEKLGAEEGRQSRIEAIIEKLSEMAEKGNIVAIKEILDRLYGKVDQKVQLEGSINLHFDKQDEEL